MGVVFIVTAKDCEGETPQLLEAVAIRVPPVAAFMPTVIMFVVDEPLNPPFKLHE